MNFILTRGWGSVMVGFPLHAEKKNKYIKEYVTRRKSEKNVGHFVRRFIRKLERKTAWCNGHRDHEFFINLRK